MFLSEIDFPIALTECRSIAADHIGDIRSSAFGCSR